MLQMTPSDRKCNHCGGTIMHMFAFDDYRHGHWDQCENWSTEKNHDEARARWLETLDPRKRFNEGRKA